MIGTYLEYNLVQLAVILIIVAPMFIEHRNTIFKISNWNLLAAPNSHML